MGEHERYNIQRLIKVRAKYLAMTWLARHGRLIARSPNSARLRRRHRGNSRASSPNAGDAGRIVARPVAGGGSNFLFADSQFQSLKLSFIVVSTVPAVLAGVVVALWLTNTTLNISAGLVGKSVCPCLAGSLSNPQRPRSFVSRLAYSIAILISVLASARSPFSSSLRAESSALCIRACVSAIRG